MLDNAGWVKSKYCVPCFACNKPIAQGADVYAPNRRDPYNIYCPTCSPKAEKAVEDLHAGRRLPYELGYSK